MRWEETMIKLIDHLEDHVLDPGGGMGLLKNQLQEQIEKDRVKKQFGLGMTRDWRGKWVKKEE